MLVDEGNENESLWADVLLEGWQVFSRSVASLQYLIESTNRLLAHEWLQQGSVALARHLEDLDGQNGLVQQELKKLERQDALDALAEPDESSMDDLEDCDRDWRTWRAAFRSYAFSALLFRERAERLAVATDEDCRFRVGYSHRDGDQPTLVPMTGFLRHFLQSVDVDARGGGARMPLSHRYVFARQNVTARAALADHVRLMRVGDPLITALERFSTNDDRGRAFAVWRADRSYSPNDASGADLYFRFDFLVHAVASPSDHSESSDDLIVQGALARKANRLLPPSFVRIWVDGNGKVIDEPSELLLAPYQDSWKGTRRDFNLNPKRWRALPTEVRSGWMRDWNTLCTRVRALAESAVSKHPEQVARCQAALAASEREARALEAQSASRQVRLTGAARLQEVDDLDRERRVHRRLAELLSRPTLYLDVVGAYFVAAEEISDL